MKPKLLRPIFILFLCAALPVIGLFQPSRRAAAQNQTATPTYDPLVEPPLPDHPTEWELGRNLYWHWCMTCHGDRGQGLTDEFRAVWPEEHQNCWGRGCHAGRQGDTGFPIPTVVPSIVNDARLSQFASLQMLADYLRATHPPQSPGILKSEEYHAIAVFVFTMNGRPLDSVIPTPTSSPAPASSGTPTPLAESGEGSVSVLVSGGILLSALGIVAFALLRRVKQSRRNL
jgi:hypothetical protein